MPHKQLGLISALIVGLLLPLLLPNLLSLRCVLSALILPLCLLLVKARALKVSGLIVLCFLCAFFFSTHQLHYLISQQLNPSLEGRDLWLQGRILHAPQISSAGADAMEDSLQYARFEMQVQNLALVSSEGIHDLDDLRGANVRLSWRRSADEVQKLRAGQTWRLLVRLKTPRGFANPKGFDYQAWLLAKNIMASGYVKGSASDNHEWISEERPSFFEGLREFYSQRLFEGRDHPLIGILQALLIGDRSKISRDQWQVFRDTGTSHLMAISGLHIGLVAVFGFWCSRRLVCPLLVFFHGYFSARAAVIFTWLPAVVSILLAGIYAGLSGFAIPTQRAWLMVVFANLAYLIGRRCDGLYLLLCVAVLILAVNPMIATQTGFWLSFAAVFFLLFCFAYKAGRRNNLSEILKAQFVVFIGLAAVLSALSIPVSVVSPVANVVAVPLMSLIIIPLVFLAALLSAVSAQLAGLIIEIALLISEFLWQFLEFLSVYNRPYLLKQDAMFIVLAVLASFLILSSPGLNLRIYGLALFAMVCFGEIRQNAALELSVLDVGQGLSIVIRENDTTWIYDTGARFSQDFDIGSAVLVPHLRSAHVNTLEAVVISHGDNDHAGGLTSLAQAFDIEQLIYNEEYDGEVIRTLCYQGMEWEMNVTRILALWPHRAEASAGQVTALDDERQDNNASCVLVIRHGDFTALLSGDIEKSVEKALLQDERLPKNIDLLIAPHHGSRSSSSKEFIRHLAPKHVVFSAGYKNRYGHPAQDIVDRYAIQGVQIWRTDRDGAISFRLENDGLIVDSAREAHKRVWYRRTGAEN